MGVRVSPAFRAGFRKLAHLEIERLIRALDVLDGDPDFELDADAEPSLGWANELCRSDNRDGSEDADLHFCTSYDREWDIADARHDGDDEDREPSEDKEISDWEADV